MEHRAEGEGTCRRCSLALVRWHLHITGRGERELGNAGTTERLHSRALKAVICLSLVCGADESYPEPHDAILL